MLYTHTHTIGGSYIGGAGAMSTTLSFPWQALLAASPLVMVSFPTYSQCLTSFHGAMFCACRFILA